jgi:hypothetical protein
LPTSAIAPDVAHRRVQWRKYQDRSEPERLVFMETFIEAFIETFIETLVRTVITDNLGGHNAKAVRS